MKWICSKTECTIYAIYIRHPSKPMLLWPEHSLLSDMSNLSSLAQLQLANLGYAIYSPADTCCLQLESAGKNTQQIYGTVSDDIATREMEFGLRWFT